MTRRREASMSPVLENHFVPKVLVFILLNVTLRGSLLEGGSSSICTCYITQHRMIKFVSFLWLGTFWEIYSKNEKLRVYLFNRLSQLIKEYYLLTEDIYIIWSSKPVQHLPILYLAMKLLFQYLITIKQWCLRTSSPHVFIYIKCCIQQFLHNIC